MSGERNGTWARLKRGLPLLREDAWLYVLAMLAAPFSTLLVVVQPWLLKQAIDVYIPQGDVAGLKTIALFYLGAVVVGALLEATYTLSLSYGALRTIARLRLTLFSHALGLARSYFDREPAGRLLTRVTSDVEALGETLTAGAVTIVLDALLVVGILVAMFVLDSRLALVSLVVGPPLAFLVDRARRVLRRLYLAVRTHLSDLNAYTSERLTGIEVVQLYSDEERSVQGYDQILGRYRDAAIRTNVFDAILYAVVDGTTAVTMALMLWYGSGSLLDGVVTAGLLAAFIDYIAKLFRPVQEFSNKIAILQRADSALVKIFDLLDTHERIASGAAHLPEEADEVVLRDVHFAYGDGPDVLHGVDLRMGPGETVAVVGRTGSGKTTLGKLLTRMYQGYRGSITVGGVEIDTVEPQEVRRRVGVVAQDVDLFPGTVRDNLSLGAPIDEERLCQAVSLAHATEVVRALGGLDGVVQHKGANLSVGEAQLLSFARTLATDCPVVILDEATASVDSLTEARIQAATEAVLAERTVLVIAHRLSTIMNADRIALLDAGEVVELGTHDELMALDGHYARLFRQQFEAEAVEV